jgi:N-hydroxyarylamine O-acetyltransferase
VTTERGSAGGPPALRYPPRPAFDPGDPSAFDLVAYLARIGYAGSREVTLETLRALHLAHVTSIPFENLDIQLGRPILLDIESIQRKLVRDRRGGYCFEQNHLFLYALRGLAFDVTPLAARVRMGVAEPTPRTHMLLLVNLADERWIADVGFGGDGLIGPIPLVADRPVEVFGWTYRLVTPAERTWLLQLERPEGWFDLYLFTEEPTPFVDYVLGNHFTSTHPESGFVRTVTAQSATPEVRLALRNRTLFEQRPGQETTVRELADDEEVLRVLDERFGLHFPPGTRFRALADPADQATTTS